MVDVHAFVDKTKDRDGTRSKGAHIDQRRTELGQNTSGVSLQPAQYGRFYLYEVIRSQGKDVLYRLIAQHRRVQFARLSCHLGFSEVFFAVS